MPELPEVEILKRFFKEAVLDKKIENIEFLDHLNKIFKSSKTELEKNLIGHHFEKVERIGKYLFAKISSGKWLHLHFGMTGNLSIYMDEDSKPRFTRFALTFEDGSRLAFEDSRKFGVVELVDSPEAFQSRKKIGTDLLLMEEKPFINALNQRKIAIKTALLEQKNFAGIGNWIADEMLFNVGIHPEKEAAQLSEKQLKELLSEAQRICKTAIAADTHYGDFPDDFFVQYRKVGAIHPDHPNSKVERLVVGGRGTFIVPEKQTL
jgi:formamidopyrimidine-DNA glycosylase